VNGFHLALEIACKQAFRMHFHILTKFKMKDECNQGL